MYKQPTNQTASLLAEKFINADARRAAYFLETLPTHEALSLIQGLNIDVTVKCVENMCHERAAALLRRMNIKQAALVLNRVNLRHAGHIYAAFPEHFQKKISAEFDASFVARLKTACAYPPNTAGAMAGGDFFVFRTDDKVKDILAKLETMPRKKTPFIVYVTDRQGRLAGSIKTGDLLFFNADSSAGSVMIKETDFIKANAQRAEAENTFKAKDLFELPVLDDNNILIGIISVNSLLKEEPAACCTDDCCKEHYFNKKIFFAVAGLACVFVIILLLRNFL